MALMMPYSYRRGIHFIEAVEAELATVRVWKSELIGFIIRRMNTIMKLDDLRSIDQLRDFLEGTQEVAFAVLTGKDERYRWMQQTLIKFHYRRLSKADKGIVFRYLMKISGYSRQQVSRLIGQYIDCRPILHAPCAIMPRVNI